jgi:hypothetical protein
MLVTAEQAPNNFFTLQVLLAVLDYCQGTNTAKGHIVYVKQYIYTSQNPEPRLLFTNLNHPFQHRVIKSNHVWNFGCMGLYW